MQEILPLAKQLLNDLQLTDYKIRLMGLTVSNPVEESDTHDPVQLSFNF